MGFIPTPFNSLSNPLSPGNVGAYVEYVVVSVHMAVEVAVGGGVSSSCGRVSGGVAEGGYTR